jgi:hypothetical protein
MARLNSEFLHLPRSRRSKVLANVNFRIDPRSVVPVTCMLEICKSRIEGRYLTLYPLHPMKSPTPHISEFIRLENLLNNDGMMYLVIGGYFHEHNQYGEMHLMWKTYLCFRESGPGGTYDVSNFLPASFFFFHQSRDSCTPMYKIFPSDIFPIAGGPEA